MLDPITLNALVTIGPSLIGAVPSILGAFGDLQKNKYEKEIANAGLELERLKIKESTKELALLKREYRKQASNYQKQSLRYRAFQSQEIERVEHSLQGSIQTLLAQQKTLEEELRRDSRKMQADLARSQRENMRQRPEAQKIFENWPLTIYPSQLLGNRAKGEVIPLRIIISPPIIQNDQFENSLADNRLHSIDADITQFVRNFLDNHYALDNPDRPTEFMGGAWSSKKARGEASIKALFGMLQSEPTLVIETEIINREEVSIRIAYWGLGQKKYAMQTIVTIPYRKILETLSIQRAIAWEQEREKLLEMRTSPEDIVRLGEEKERNLKLFLEKKRYEERGINTSILSIREYEYGQKDVDEYCDLLCIIHCLIAGWVSDTHFFTHNDTPPALPRLLPGLLAQTKMSDCLDPVMNDIFSAYQEVLSGLYKERPSLIPEMALLMAEGLVGVSDTQKVEQQFDYSMQAWLKQKKVIKESEAVRETIVVEELEKSVTSADSRYLGALKRGLGTVGRNEDVEKIQQLEWIIQSNKIKGDSKCQNAIAQLKHRKFVRAIELFDESVSLNPTNPESYFGRAYSYAFLDRNDAAIDDFTQAIRLRPDYADAYRNRGDVFYRLKSYGKALSDYKTALNLGHVADQQMILAVKNCNRLKR